jgi:hypothetical protein
MPRRSAAALAVIPSVVPLLPARPMPPAYLPADAAELWRTMTASRPADYFDAASLPTLETLVRAMAEHRRLMALCEAMDPAADPAAYGRLARVADAMAARASQAATRLRLTHQSATDSRGAGRAARTGGARASADEIAARYRRDQ